MKTIHIIDKLVLEQDTLCAKGANGRLQPVHLRQGDMDGACAVYSLMMAMLTCGIINRKDAMGLYKRIDGRSSLAKLLKQLTLQDKKEGLVREGLYLDWVNDVATHTFTKEMGTSYSDSINDIKEITHYLDGNDPVVIGATFRKKDGGHALVAVGYESYNDVVTKIFCLDPGFPLPDCSYWNAIIHVNCNSAKEYKHTYMPTGRDIKIDETITIFNK